MTVELPTLAQAKTQAKQLRAERAAQASQISHSEALETIARGYGFRDWNGLHAAIRDLAPQGWRAGGRLTGKYLKQSFVATVRSCEPSRPGWFRLVLDLDTPVDVVHFESFSNLRKQLRVLVGPDGRSKERTSDGTPHVMLDQR